MLARPEYALKGRPIFLTTASAAATWGLINVVKVVAARRSLPKPEATMPGAEMVKLLASTNAVTRAK